jgi:MFS family permease
MNSTISSSLATGATTQIRNHFHITSETLLVLPTSIFLAGYIIGPFFWGPLSESYGRKWIMIIAFLIFTIFSAASAGAPSFAGLIVFRLFVGVAGSCPIAVVSGICADVYQEPVSRGKAMAIFMVSSNPANLQGPTLIKQ